MVGALNQLETMQVYAQDKCPKCGSIHSVRYTGWRSLESGTIFMFNVRCLDCKHEWSW
jgi:hypothetical protein